MKEITVEWTGSFPNLCAGSWLITIGGVLIDLPEDVKNAPMGIHNTYPTWGFTENWDEEWTDYEDGDTYKEWLTRHSNWLKPLKLTNEELEILFVELQIKDWRHNSCGGCI